MKKLLIYLGLADEPAPLTRNNSLRTIQIDRDMSTKGYNEWRAYICEQLGYPKDVLDRYKKQI